MARRTEELSEFLKQNASSQELSETLTRALNQLQALDEPAIAEEASDAFGESLALTDMELKELAQSLRNMQDLEEAMRAMQAARAACELSAKGSGEGEAGAGSGQPSTAQMDPAEALKAYREYFEGLVPGAGSGPGMLGPGTGSGGVAAEDPSQKNAFKTEKSRSSLRAGKILMTLKVKEVGDRGEVTQEYAEQVKQVKQGASEAILQERVPPGYHQGIKKYFDDLGKQPGKAKKK